MSGVLREKLQAGAAGGCRFWQRTACSACLGLFAALTAAAHGVDAFDISAAGGAAARFVYSTGEPMMYAVIRLYPPSAPEAEVLQGVADRNGVFCFLPDEEGPWRVSAEDGLGHKSEITLAAGAAQAAAPPPPAAGRLPRPVAAVLGISLILNLAAGAGAAARRRRNAH